MLFSETNFGLFEGKRLALPESGETGVIVNLCMFVCDRHVLLYCNRYSRYGRHGDNSRHTN